MKRDPLRQLIVFSEWVLFLGALCGLILVGYFMLNAESYFRKNLTKFVLWFSN